MDIMNDKQNENTATTLLDIAKALFIGFGIGYFIPNSSITAGHMIWSTIIAVALYIVAMLLLKEVK